MNCGDCREFLLEGEPEEIARALGDASEERSFEPVEGGAIAAWREHLRACASCAGAAKRILEARRELATDLESLTPLRPLAEGQAWQTPADGRLGCGCCCRGHPDRLVARFQR
jgi:hypothetical protein